MHPEVAVEAVAKLAQNGLRASEIARRTGIPRSTVRDWLGGQTPRRDREASCENCGGRRHSYSALPSRYVYLLGMYLGDGCIPMHPREVYRLRIVLDLMYPGVIEECEDAVRAVTSGNQVTRVAKPGRCLEVASYSKAWPCLFPQHGPGRKHTRSIELTMWQRDLVRQRPDLLLRGLVHSDGCRFTNTGRGGWECPRYSFCNRSEDIKAIFCEACSLLGLRWTRSGSKTIYVSRKRDVELLDMFIGPKT